MGTWLLTAKQQPLEIDYIELLGKEDPAFSKKESGWREFCFGVQSFILSFFQDYEVVSGKVGGEGPGADSVARFRAATRRRSSDR